ncbi:hypothetical protein C8046_13620 [Serinibacter arcticus]|uniref:DUF4232 domain-containing protein n=1 Tax=Serinibacter arcticus TaxID=1655435 RepID=A0A2U1ZX65_9MICO|nr:DUF4232 domain-containing protein [Serinibacter arcticus]PWD51540.1 hypothetical protein C8046_13620 [Serinibacter arcticus]
MPPDPVVATIPSGGDPVHPGSSPARTAAPWRRLAWLTLPVLTAAAVLLADALRTWAAGSLVAASWHSLDPWLPTVLPARVGWAVAPWPALLTTATLATVVLVTAALALVVLRAVAERRRVLRFLLLWLAAVVGGVVAVGATQLGDVLHVIDLFGGRGGSWIRTFTLPALVAAVRWGLVWGLVPALLTTLLVPARVPPDVLGPWSRRAPVLLLLAAVVAGLWLTSTARSASVSTMTEVATPEPTADPGPSDPPPTVAPGDGSAAANALPGRCDEADLVTTAAHTDAATGRRFGVATTTNTGDATCLVVGLPDLAFADEDGDAVVPVVEPWGGFSDGGVPGDGVLEQVDLGVPVTLEPGASATAELTWRGSGAGAITVEKVLVAPWPGAQRTVVDEWMDLETGAILGVAPWRAAPDPASAVD